MQLPNQLHLAIPIHPDGLDDMLEQWFRENERKFVFVVRSKRSTIATLSTDLQGSVDPDAEHEFLELVLARSDFDLDVPPTDDFQ